MCFYIWPGTVDEAGDYRIVEIHKVDIDDVAEVQFACRPVSGKNSAFVRLHYRIMLPDTRLLSRTG